MNAAQRKFLVDKIQKQINNQIEGYEKQLIKYPSTSNYLFKAAMEGTLELQPAEVILDAIKKKALSAKEGENWLSDLRMGYEKEREIRLWVKDIIKLPKDYKKAYIEMEDHNAALLNKIKELKTQLNTIEIRIQLSSNKKLESLISEVDDLGDFKLIDTKLKLLEP